MQGRFDRLGTLGRLVRKAGPYLLLEVLMPGGTLLALLLFFCRSGRLKFGDLGTRMRATPPVIERISSWPTPSLKLGTCR